MTKDIPKEFQFFDDMEKNFQFDESKILRRTAFQLIYDYYMRILWEIKDDLELKIYFKKYMGLKMRWILIRRALINTNQDETIIKWNKTITDIASIRDSIAHSDSSPSINKLRNFRELGVEFKTWLISSVERYSEVKEALTVSDSIWRHNIFYVQHISDILREFGNKPPLIAKDLETRSMDLIMLAYNELPDIVNLIERGYNDFKKLNFDELTILLELCKYITGFRVMEHVFLEKSKCPVCGGNIEQTPYRIGCDKCDYFTHEEL